MSDTKKVKLSYQMLSFEGLCLFSLDKLMVSH